MEVLVSLKAITTIEISFENKAGYFFRLPNGTVEVVDAREIAPLAANETMFKGRPEAALSGGLASAVPLELLGLFSAHTRHGKLPWASLVHPVADVAESGFAAHPYLVSALERMNFTEKSELQDLMETFYVQDKVLGTLRPPRVNETCCKRPALAAFLRLVAEQGPQVLYTGQYADEFAKDIQEAGGIITSKDLARAAVSIKQALKTNVFGLEFFVPPPPSSGAAVLSALHILAGWDLPLAGAGALGVHRTAEAMKHVFAIRASIGDPGPDSNKHKSFVPSLSEVLHDALSHKYTEKLREMVVDDDVLDMMSYGGKWNLKKAGVPPKDAGTSHLNAVDDLGMAVALTSTVNTGFGAKFISRSTGILLNNQMDDFSTPGQHNIYGLPPSVANFIVPGKKPLSSMSPMIVQQDGRLRAVLGASGGPRIISAVLQTLLRLFAYGEDLFSAVAGPRLHHQLVPDVLYAEDWTAGGLELHYKNETLTQLAARHHHVMPTVWGAVVQAITLNEKLTNTTMIKRSRILTAVSDPRKDGAPAAL